MDNNSRDFTRKTVSTDFTRKTISTRRDDIESSRSISEWRNIRNSDIESLGTEFDEINKKLQIRLDYLDKIKEKGTAEINTTNELTRLSKKLNDIKKSNNIEYAETLETLKETVDALEKAERLSEKLQVKAAKSKKEVDQIRNETNDTLEDLSYFGSDITRKMGTHKKANQSKVDEFTKNLSSFREQVRDLAIVTGMNTLAERNNASNALQNMYGSGSFDKMQSSAFNNLVSNYGLGDTLTKFNYKDMLEYVGRLEQLGINSLDIAQQQADDIMFGVKYLGMSVETQGKILKVSRDTGNMDLLTESNETMVRLMNAQLGISKTQLEKTVQQAAELNDIINFYSKDSTAMSNFANGLAAIEKMYGKESKDAVNNLATRILNNDTSLLQYMPGFYNIQSKLASGDETALNDIVKAVQNSSMVNAMSNANGKLGLPDSDIRNIYTARNSTNGTFDGWVEFEKNQSKDTNKFLESLATDAMTMLGNIGSWINKWIPISSLQAMYYPLAIADLIANSKLITKGWSWIKSGFGKIGELTGITGKLSGAIGTAGAGGGAGAGGTGLIGVASKALPILSLIAGSVMAISDGIEGAKKSEEWGTSKPASFLGGLLGGTDADETTRILKNGVKGMLIGAGIGGLIGACFAGIGAIPGAIIGGLLGLAVGAGLGAIGGKNIAGGIDSMFGSAKDSGGVNTAPVTNLSNAKSGSFTGKGGSAGGRYPWTKTSPFGYRGSIETSAGYTNPFHNGVDLAYSSGTPIGANNSGMVSAVGTDGSRGNYAIINSGDGYEQVYYHMIQPSHLVKGQAINAGQLVGYMGSTGMSTGTHLHFGMRKSGTQDYIDPEPYINNELFTTDPRGTPGLGVMSGMYGSEEEGDELRSTTLIARTIDASTLSNYAGGGIGGEAIVDSVDNGFANLIDKLDELSRRQDEQEEMLSLIAGSGTTNLLKY